MDKGGGMNFVQTLKRGVDFFHVSLANKCNKKVFIKNKQLNLSISNMVLRGCDVDIFYAFEGVEVFFCRCEKGVVVSFDQIFQIPTPTSIK